MKDFITTFYTIFIQFQIQRNQVQLATTDKGKDNIYIEDLYEILSKFINLKYSNLH